MKERDCLLCLADTTNSKYCDECIRKLTKKGVPSESVKFPLFGMKRQ